MIDNENLALWSAWNDILDAVRSHHYQYDRQVAADLCGCGRKATRCEELIAIRKLDEVLKDRLRERI